MIEKCCAFTGHRPSKLPWGYDEEDNRCVLLKLALAAQVAKLSAAGYTDFFSGMAEGCDTWAAMAVLAVKQWKPALKLHCILPWEGQADRWSAAAQERYHAILEQADSVLCVNRTYHKNCMLERNRYLVDHTDCLVAVYNGEQRGGTAMTVRYAQKLGRKILFVAPHFFSDS